MAMRKVKNSVMRSSERLSLIHILGAIAALDGPQDIVRRNRDGYRKRRDALCGGLRSVGWNVPDAKATMFTLSLIHI